MKKIGIAIVGGNSELINNAAELYISDGDVVLDVTYGKGVFWKDTDTSRFNLKKNDIQTLEGKEKKCLGRLDQYKDESIDVVVLDPPYAHTPGS